MRALKQTMAMIVMAGTILTATIAAAATVNVKSKEGIGPYLADEKGITLYLFKKDAPDKSACTAANGCLDRWPIFYVDKVAPSAGIDPAAFGTIIREDGKKQTTYKKQPLYYFFKDKGGEDVHGQGLNNVWYVVAP